MGNLDHGKCTLDNSASTIATFRSHEEVMIDILRIRDKTDSMSDDKSTYQCKSVQFDSPILIESSDCDSDTGIQSFFIVGKRGRQVPQNH